MKSIYLLHLIALVLLFNAVLSPQQIFYPTTYWEVQDSGLAFNIESYDMNRDNKTDIISGNWNDTYVYYGGYGVLDDTVDLIYTGRMLFICDYNGDGNKDMIAMHFTRLRFDNGFWDYDGNILFYWGNPSNVPAIDTIADYSIPIPTAYPKTEEFTLGNIDYGMKSGDFNGDGKSDIVLNSYVYPLGRDYGKIYIYMGAEIPPNTPSFTGQGKYLDNDYGTYFDIGDINGDQFDDLLISSNKFNTIYPIDDSLNILQIYYGNSDFTFNADSASVKYISKINYNEHWGEWFTRIFSIDDINGDGIDDLVLGRKGLQDNSTNIHFGNISGLDTIPSYRFFDPDTTDDVSPAGGISRDIGDYNNDGYHDFIFFPGGWKTFAIILGGPNISNGNPYGISGSLNAHSYYYPYKGITAGKQNSGNVNDIAVNIRAGDSLIYGYIKILLGASYVADNNEDKGENAALSFILDQNFPNPFNSQTIIKYRLYTAQFVDLKIFDLLGGEIAALVNEKQSPGTYEIEFDAEKYKLSSGIYLYKLRNENMEIIKKMTYIK